MAFSNLFSKLASFDEDVRSPDRSGCTFRNKSENRGGARWMKRKTQDEQHGSYRKKSCSQFQKTSASHAFGDSYSPAKRHQKQSTGNYCSAGRANGVRTNQRSKPDHINKQSCNGQHYKSKKNNGKMTQKTNKNKQRYRDRIITQAKPRFMTQEFKDQNALLVDGRLLCRHFLFGRCIKEDTCQLLHVQGCNDMIKEACKFYIQGFCQKGDACIYMHKSFPCKFFHRKGKCSQEGNCRFSHDALNDVTEKLLDEALKQEKEYHEVRKKEKEEETEANQDPDALTEPLRPTFYNSTDTVKETDPLQLELSVPDLAEPRISPTDDPNHQEPVCYSVEAMLGPQLSRTFSSFSKTPGSQESSDKTENSSHQTKQLAEILQNSKKKHSTDEPSASKITPKSRRTSNQVGLVEAQRPFIRRSADPLTGCAAPSAGSESLLKPERSADVRGSSSAFLGLFATPLSASDPRSRSQTSRSAHTASGLESISSGLRTEARQTPLRQTSLTPLSLKTDDAAAKQTAAPGSCRSEPQPPDVSAPRETSNSVLKTLFLHLKPFQEDRDHQLCRQSFIHPAATVALLGHTEPSSIYSADGLLSSATSGESETRGAEERQLKERKQWNGRKQNDLSTEKTSLLRTDLRSRTRRSEGPGRSTVSVPFEAATRHRGPGAKPTSEEGAAVSRNAAVTPLKDLFKTLGAFSPPM
ncbi:uncharacterized protein LOC119423047 [Nematolebias whitei]|uniref:uncharacterized protein LOC119423047 n=1 Tax=Nematolebias whitei TaxID=451745 RepID=UPI00189A3B65|nr:uncharacterized protein LOC119423047 [Nematolebias whitei]